MTNCGEIIGLFLTKRIEPNLSVEETINLIKEQDGLIYLPHPYDEKRYKTVLNKDEQLKFKSCFDFVEIHNGRNIKKEYSLNQKKRQKMIGATRIVGSDAHVFFELGRNYILMEYNGKDSFIKDVEAGKVHKADCIMFAHFCTKIARVITMIEKGDLSGIYRIIVRGRREKK